LGSNWRGCRASLRGVSAKNPLRGVSAKDPLRGVSAKKPLRGVKRKMTAKGATAARKKPHPELVEGRGGASKRPSSFDGVRMRERGLSVYDCKGLNDQ